MLTIKRHRGYVLMDDGHRIDIYWGRELSPVDSVHGPDRTRTAEELIDDWLEAR